MARAYAALVSLMQIIEQTKQHPCPPICLEQTQVESLCSKVYFLQNFLEHYSHGSNEADGLERRIADAAQAAEDIIESGIADRILAGSTSHEQKTSTSVDFEEGLQKVIDDMDSIMEGMKMRIKEETTSSQQVQLQANPRPAAYPPRSEQNIMVGLDNELSEILDKLAGNNRNRLIIPIVGMAGIGKTTLARNVYMHPLVHHHFDIRAWTTISQEYSTLEIFRELLSQFNIISRGDSIEKREGELGLLLHQFLINRRYLIILDDMWNIEAWERIQLYCPCSESGSRIIVTTRLSPLAHILSDSYKLQMSFLDDDKSWYLFCKIVFGDRGCPLELREAGKKITIGCKGLPLSIVVIGGLLTKSEYKREYWEDIAENLNSVVNLEDNERCSNILYTSYNQLPVHLKPCFLYMGVFPEDEVIHVSMLIKLWVSEGFLKPISGKSMELVAQDYVRDLIDRNLILVRNLGSTDNIKYCNIHDLLRDLCLREAQKERFYNVIKQPGSAIEQYTMNNSIRIVLSECLSSREKNFGASARHARSLICNSGETPSLYDFRLLRIWKTFDKDSYEGEDLNFPENMSHLVNLRYVAVTAVGGSEFCSSIHRFWNLQTLIVNQVWPNSRSSEIWNMPLLRHVEFTELELPDPPRSDDGVDQNDVVMRNCNVDDDMHQNDVVMINLLTLSRVRNFKCSEQIVKRIPNVKKLIVFYDNLEANSDYCLENVERLHKLESFGFFFFQSGPNLFQNLTFPHSLKKLTISHFHWEEMLEKIGSLPLLEKLKLMNGYLRQRKWETSEEQFCNLKFLRIDGCNLEWWLTDSTHFPRLEHLVLCNLDKLKEIPSDVGEIPTLESIRLEFCSNSAAVSARRILEDQEEFGNTDLHVRVLVRGRNRIPKSSKNFQVESIPN